MEILWLALAYVMGMGAQIFRLPPLIGYLLAGILLSVSGIEFNEYIIHEIGHIGVLLLLFTVGLHLRIKNIIQPEVFGGGGLHLFVNAGIFTGVAMLFGYELVSAILIGVLLGFSSTVLAAKALENRGELGAYHGRVAIGILILQDLVAIVILALTGGGLPSIWSIGLLILPLLRPLLLKLFVASGHEELQLLFGLILAVGTGTLFEVLGLSSELGALAAGALLSGHQQADELAEKMWGMKEVFLVGFFLEVGLAGLPDMNALAFTLVIIAILPLKSLLYFFILIGFKLRARHAFMVMTTLTSYSEFTIIAGAVAASNGYIPESALIAMALITAVSYAINAPIASNSTKLWNKFEFKLLPYERNVKHPGDSVVNLGGADYLILGMGQAGAAAYDYLKDRELRVTGMDSDPARIENNLKERRRVVYGDAYDPELWQNIDLSGVHAIMLSMSNFDTKVQATKMLRENNFEGKIFALTMRDEEHMELAESGANAVCLPMKQAGRKLAELSISSEIISTTTSISMDYA
ncbi:MAG: cation:proton antiporter [Balneolales bacterium]|nr:cation:proton antiporter [Balneolales bacterium]